MQVLQPLTAEMGVVATLLVALMVTGGPGRPSLVAAAIDGAEGAGASCPRGCVCSADEVACRNLDLESAPVEELRASGRDWSGVTKL